MPIKAKVKEMKKPKRKASKKNTKLSYAQIKKKAVATGKITDAEFDKRTKSKQKTLGKLISKAGAGNIVLHELGLVNVPEVIVSPSYKDQSSDEFAEDRAEVIEMLEDAAGVVDQASNVIKGVATFFRKLQAFHKKMYIPEKAEKK